MSDAAFAGEEITVEDRLLIQDLITRFGRTYDDRDAEGWAALFSESAAMPSTSREGSPES